RPGPALLHAQQVSLHRHDPRAAEEMTAASWFLTAALEAAALGVAASASASAAGLPDSPSASTATFVSPSTAAYSSVEGIVRDIRVRRLNVFDLTVPGEDWWI